MSNGTRQSHAEQIQEVKNRFFAEYIEGGIANLQSRVHTLQAALTSVSETTPELFRYFPVAATAIIETYFKSIISMVIDKDKKYLDNGLKLISDKTLKTVEGISIITSGSASAGQLIAHLQGCSSIGVLEVKLSELLGLPLKQILRKAADPYAIRAKYENPRLVVNDVDELWRNLDLMFKQRHIIAHEAAPLYSVSREEAFGALSACQEFMQGVDAVLFNNVWVDVPLTQYEMNMASYELLLSLRAELTKIIKLLRRGNLLDRRRHTIWRKFFLIYMTDYATETMGSIRPMLVADQASKLIQDRINDLKGILGYI